MYKYLFQVASLIILCCSTLYAEDIVLDNVTVTNAEEHRARNVTANTVDVQSPDGDLTMSVKNKGALNPNFKVKLGARLLIRNVPNTPPVAVNDTYNGLTAGVLTTVTAPGVLVNDTDIDAGLADFSVISFTQGSHGVVNVSADGSFTYNHTNASELADSFTYTMQDEDGATSTATVTLNLIPSNQPPVAEPDSWTLDEDAVLNENVITNADPNPDSDPDNDPITAILVTPPSHHDDQGGSSPFVLNADGTFSYDHDGTENFNDSFTYKVNDGTVDSSVVTVTLTINELNDPPLISGTPATEVNAGEQYLFVPTASDEEGATLVFSLNLTLPAWATFNTATGSITGTPAVSDIGVISNIIISVSDNVNPDVSLPAFSITINPMANQPPALDNLNFVATEGKALERNDATGLLATAIDPDGDIMTVSLVSNVSQGELELEEDGSFIYIHDGNESGANDSFTFNVSDGELTTGPITATIAITPHNDPVSIDNTISSGVVNEGELFTHTVIVSDPDDAFAEISFQLLNHPASMQITNGVITWTPDDSIDQTNLITLIASDGLEDGAAPASQQFILQVNKLYDLTINGSMTSHFAGDVVAIAAGTPPNAGEVFQFWSGDTQGVLDIFADTTSITMPAADATLAPVFADPASRHVVQFVETTLTVSEGSIGDAEVSVIATPASPLPAGIQVPFTIIPDTADASDYENVDGILLIPSAAEFATIQIIPVVDSLDEIAGETFDIQLQAPIESNVAILGTNTLLTVTIEDRSTVEFETPNTLARTEPASGSNLDGTISVILNRAPGADEVYNVNWQISGSAEEGVDYTLADADEAGILRFTAGETTKTLNYSIIGDTHKEPSEDIIITLVNANGMNIGSNNTYTITINDDDPGAVSQVAFADANTEQMVEGVGTGQLLIPVVIDTPINATVDVEVSVTAVDAELGTDFIVHNDVVTIPANQTTGQISIVVIDDSIVENDAVLTVTLQNPSNAELGAIVTKTINLLDNDVDAPAFALHHPGTADLLEENFTGGNFVGPIKVSMSAQASGSTIEYTLSAGDPDQAYTLGSTIDIAATATVRAQAEKVVDGTTYQSAIVDLPIAIYDANDYQIPNDGGASHAHNTTWDLVGPTDDLDVTVSGSNGQTFQFTTTSDSGGFTEVYLTGEGQNDINTSVSDRAGNTVVKNGTFNLSPVLLSTPSEEVFIRIGDKLVIKNDTTTGQDVSALSATVSHHAVAPGQTITVAFAEVKNGYADITASNSKLIRVKVAANPFDYTHPLYAQVGFTRTITVSDDRLSYETADLEVLTVGLGGATGGYEFDSKSITVTPEERGLPVVVARLPGTNAPVVGYLEVLEFTAERILRDKAYYEITESGTSNTQLLKGETAIAVRPAYPGIEVDISPYQEAAGVTLPIADEKSGEVYAYYGTSFVDSGFTLDATVNVTIKEGEDDVQIGQVDQSGLSINSGSATVDLDVTPITVVDGFVTSPDRAKDNDMTITITGLNLQELYDNKLIKKSTITQLDVDGTGYVFNHIVVTLNRDTANTAFQDKLQKKVIGIDDFVYSLNLIGYADSAFVSKYFRYQGVDEYRYVSIAGERHDLNGILLVRESNFWDEFEGGYNASLVGDKSLYTENIQGYALWGSPVGSVINNYDARTGYSFIGDNTEPVFFMNWYSQQSSTVSANNAAVRIDYLSGKATPSFAEIFMGNSEFEEVVDIDEIIWTWSPEYKLFDQMMNAFSSTTTYQNLINTGNTVVPMVDLSQQFQEIVTDTNGVPYQPYWVQADTILSINEKTITKKVENKSRQMIEWYVEDESNNKSATYFDLQSINSASLWASIEPTIDDIWIRLPLGAYPAGADPLNTTIQLIDVMFRFNNENSGSDLELDLDKSMIFGDLYKIDESREFPNSQEPDVVKYSTSSAGRMYLKPGLYIFDVGADQGVECDGIWFNGQSESLEGGIVGPQTVDDGIETEKTIIDVNNIVAVKVLGTVGESTELLFPNSYRVWSTDLQTTDPNTDKKASLKIIINQHEFVNPVFLEQEGKEPKQLTEARHELPINTSISQSGVTIEDGVYTWTSTETTTAKITSFQEKMNLYHATVEFPKRKYLHFEEMMDGIEEPGFEIVTIKMLNTIPNLGYADPWEAYQRLPTLDGFGEVNLTNGNLFLQFPLKAFGTQEPGPDLTLNYNSLDVIDSGFGAGWRTNYDIRVYRSYHALTEWTFPGPVDGPDVTIVDETGRVHLESDVDIKYISAQAHGPKEERYSIAERIRVIFPDRPYMRFYFDKDGYLLRTADHQGRNIHVNRLSTGARAISTISDDYGRTVTLSEYLDVDANKHILKEIKKGLSDKWVITQDDKNYNISKLVQTVPYGTNKQREYGIKYHSDHKLKEITYPLNDHNKADKEKRKVTYNFTGTSVSIDDNFDLLFPSNTIRFSSGTDTGTFTAPDDETVTYDYTVTDKKLEIVDSFTNRKTTILYNDRKQAIDVKVELGQTLLTHERSIYLEYQPLEVPGAGPISLLSLHSVNNIKGIGGIDRISNVTTAYDYYMTGKRAGLIQHHRENTETLASFTYTDDGYIDTEMDAKVGNTDKGRNTVKYDYTGTQFGNVKKEILPNQAEEIYAYADAEIGEVHSITNTRSGITRVVDRDDQLRPTTTTIKAGSTTINKSTYTYNAQMQMTNTALSDE